MKKGKLTPLKGQSRLTSFFTKKPSPSTRSLPVTQKSSTENGNSLRVSQTTITASEKLQPNSTIREDQKLQNSDEKENVAPLTPQLSRLSSQLEDKATISQEKFDKKRRNNGEGDSDGSPVAKAPFKKRRKIIAFSDSSDEDGDDHVQVQAQPFLKKEEPQENISTCNAKRAKARVNKTDPDFESVTAADSSATESDMDFDDDDFDLGSDFSDIGEKESPKKPKKNKHKKSVSRCMTPLAEAPRPAGGGNNSVLEKFKRATPNPPQQVKANIMQSRGVVQGGGKYFHEKLGFLQPGKIRDKNKNRPDHPDYDPGTLYVNFTEGTRDGFPKGTPPMTYQFFNLKQSHFDVVFMFKVGKFYEFYHMDAQIAIDHLGLKRQNGDNLKCGVPEMACDRYMRGLVEAGYKAARVEQTENDVQYKIRQQKKEITCGNWELKTKAREICAIATAGTVSSANAFSFHDTDGGKAKGYFFSIYVPEEQGDRVGISAVHCGRGEWFFTFFEDDDRYYSKLLGILSQFKVTQLLFPKKSSKRRDELVQKLYSLGIFVERRREGHFWSPEQLLKFLTQLRVEWRDTDPLFKTLFACGAEPETSVGAEVILPALGALCQYFQETKLAHTVLTRPIFKKLVKGAADVEDQRDDGRKMIIDAVSQTNLDIEQLFKRIDYTQTDFGRRELFDWVQAPIMSTWKLERRQKAIKFLVQERGFRQEIVRRLLSYKSSSKTEDMKRLPDVPNILQRLKTLSREGLPKDHPDTRAQIYEAEKYSKSQLDAFCQVLTIFEQVWKNLNQVVGNAALAQAPELLREILSISNDNDHGFPDLTDDIKFWKCKFDRKKALETGKITPRAGKDPEYDALLAKLEVVKDEMDQFVVRVAEELGIAVSKIARKTKPKKPHMLVIDAKYERQILDCDFSIESTERATKKKPKMLVVTRKSDQMVHAFNLKTVEDEIAEFLRNQNTLVFIQWVKSAPQWLKLVNALKVLDCLISLAAYTESESDEMCIPVFLEDGTKLIIDESRHPCIRLSAGQSFVPNSVAFDDRKVMILTGPNMGGKSTIMRQVALNVILAQIGCFVPAKSMQLSVVDRIFTRIGGADHIIKGESTFFVELSETSSILRHATQSSFVIIDELGRGTATHDGCAIARAVFEELIIMNVMAIVSTHYHSLVDSIQQEDSTNLQLAHMQCYEERDPDTQAVTKVTCLYQLAEGICPQSHGFACASKALIPDNVIENGKRFANELERMTNVLVNISKLFV